MSIPARRFAQYSIIAAIAALPLFASAGLPWEGPLNDLKTSLTGPVAKAIGVIALAVAGGMLAFGGELGDFTKRIMMVVMALSVMLLANNFMSMFGA
ncbi:TrbC/VirB2 family protein [Chitinimonas arctica]|nr:TrbC/VirB2 family protein [Chitinimonas arctica]